MCSGHSGHKRKSGQAHKSGQKQGHSKAPQPGGKTQPLALVTGGAQRIGAALVTHLAERGFALAIHYHNSHTQAEQLAELCRALGVPARCWQADMRDEQALLAMCHSLGQVDLLVNNASLFHQDELAQLNYAGLQECFTTNLFAPLLLARQLGQGCSQVINMLDSRVGRHSSRLLSYSLSKLALANATRMLAQRLAPHTRVNALCPGPVLPPGDQPQAYIDRLIARTPLRQPPTTGDLCTALDYLLDSPGVTGQLMFVDSGDHLL